MSDDKDENIRKYTATLTLAVTECEEALGLINFLESATTIDVTHLGWWKGLAGDFLVLKIANFFDDTRGSVSYKKLLNDAKNALKDADLRNYQQKLKEIEEKYQLLIARAKNNRDKRIAHIQKKEELGWTKERVDAYIENYGQLWFDVKIVDPEFEFLQTDVLPIQEIKELLSELKLLVFYDLWYPNVRRDL